MAIKTQSPGISTVLHWQSPDVHIFNIDKLLLSTAQVRTEEAIQTVPVDP